MNRFLLIILFISVFIIISCKGKRSGNNNKVDPETIYFDYKITGEEGDNNLTVMLQYRDGSEEGAAISIGEWGRVTLDGETVPGDSTKMTGVFYEFHKTIATFAGKHSIVFTDFNKKEYKEEFNFQPFSLLTPVADTLQRSELLFDPMVIGFAGLETEDYVRVLLTDTSFANDGINRVDTVRGGRVTITETDLKNLANGPVQLEFIREYERPIRNGTERGGKLSINYSLKREFILND